MASNVRKLPIKLIAEDNKITGDVFIYPKDGQVLLKEILNYLQKDFISYDPFILDLDFSGITYCSTFFCEELVINLQRYIRGETKYLMCITNLEDIVRQSLYNSLILYRKKTLDNVPLLEYKGGQYEIFGEIEDNLRETFNLVTQQEYISSARLMELKKLAKNSASNRLKKLYDFRMVDRIELSDKHGSPQLYFLPQYLAE